MNEIDEKLAESNWIKVTQLSSIFIPRYTKLKFKMYVQLNKSIKSIDYPILLYLQACIINVLLVIYIASFIIAFLARRSG